MKMRIFIGVLTAIIFNLILSIGFSEGGDTELKISSSEQYSYYLPYFSSNSNHWTGVGFKNCSTSSSANVDVLVYDTDGSVIENDTVSVAPKGRNALMVGDGQPDEGWVGINSTQPLVGLSVVTTEGENNYMADIPFVSEPSTMLYVPHISQSPYYDTCVMVCNPNMYANTVTITFVNRQGVAVSSKSKSIEAYGSWKYELKNMLDSSIDNTGSVEISASHGIAAFALFNNLKTGGYSYAGISAIVPPDVSENYTYYLPFFMGHTNHWTGVGFKNCSISSSANVDLLVFDANGSIIENDTVSVAPKGRDALMVGDGQPDEGWVRINSTQPLVGLSVVTTEGENNYMADIPFVSEPSTMLYVPHISQSPYYDTCVMVCNPNMHANTVTITFVNQQGVAVSSKSQSIDVYGSWKYELKNMLDSSIDNTGSVEISASHGIAAFALFNNLKTGGYSYAGISAIMPPDVSGNIDNDGDGFTENQGDCNDGNNGIHPGATEVCGDGIDQDCDGNDEVCEPENTYAFEDFDDGSEGFFAYPPFYLMNNRFAFRGDDSFYYSFTTWNGGDNPSMSWHPKPINSNYFNDFNVSVITNWDSGSTDYSYGLSICVQQNLLGGIDSIEFDLAKSGYYAIFKTTNSSYETMASWTPSFLPNIDGQDNKLAIEKENNSFRFFINDVEVEQLLIDGFSGGGIALGSTGLVDVSFDDFNVTEPFEGQLVIPSSGYLEKLKELVYKVMTTTYLWYDTVPSVDLGSYSSAETLLDDLMYEELDKWSYITPKEEYHNLMEEGKYIGSGFGMKYSDTNELCIKFVYQDSPAAAAGLSRGDKLIEINGKTIEEIETNSLWDMAFGDDEVGTPVTLKIEDLEGLTRELSFEKDWVTVNTVLFSDVLNIDDLKIGYLVFNEFLQTAAEELDPIFIAFKQEKIDELILDLRYNPGGSVYIAQYLSELIAGEHVEGGVFAEFVHNDKYSAWDVVYDFSTTIANSIDLERVAVITTGESCSASELLINSLQPYIDVVVVGDTTCGKPVGMIGYDLFDMHISPIECKSLNADGNGEYYDGIEPTCHSGDDLTRQFGDTQENSLMKALNYVQNDSCTSGALTSGIMQVKGQRKEVPLRGFRREIGAF